MNIRNVAIGVIASALAAGVVISCGGGGGYGGDTPAAGIYTVSGNVTGSTAASVVKLNGGSDVALTSAGGAFSFTGLANGTTFNVQLVNGTDRCSVSANGAGTIGAADVTGVTVTCIAQGTQNVVRSTRLTGAQENPSVATSGSGTGGIIFDPTTNAITGGVTVFNLAATSVGIYQAPSGNPTGNSAGAAIITLGAADAQTYFVPAGTTLTAGQVTSLFAGELYFNVITAAQSGGEIRGQINLQGGVLASAPAITFAQETAGGTDVGCTGKTTSGQGAVIVDQATRAILISYMTHDVTNADLSHIHTSPLGPTTNGAVIINFVAGPILAYPAVAGAQMTAQNMSDFGIGYLYFNIHSTADGCPSGEIRGNIVNIP